MARKEQPIYSDQSSTIKKHKKILILAAVLVIVGALITGGILKYLQNAGRPSNQEYPVLGMMIDQSDGYQDFRVLKDHGVDFVYMKATEGSTYSDDNFESNFSRVKGSQIPFGFYHVVSFETPAKEQFRNIVDTVGQQRGSLPFVLHVSAYGKYAQAGIPKKKAEQNVRSLFNDIRNYYEDVAIVQVDTKSEFLAKKFPRVWYASDQKPRNNWILWQYSSSTRIPGYAGGDDYRLSVLNGQPQQLDGLIQTR
ncbi:GH25 family lysozyme [Lactobacillus sp. YT155]|uniref:GH25 family lysozyme n=1 Tax=Lactobacillus sp. YT155 TaxID=3060955 RepID=UPI00265FF1C7|nr:GH25 family lysozyme [Lactobacillus sp. YT155]MDO1605207.1 GH25 family lysozyme [Lactobacillus sp. YT155]